jgi:protein-disulfide isomerase-like protein with CxxC motif
MGKNERQAYLKAIRSRYSRARRRAKVAILDEFCAACGYNRKYAIRLLNQTGRSRSSRRPGHKSRYDSAEFLRP